jgi:DNA-binding transcriptional MerR regulator
MILLVPPLPPYSLDQLADASGEKARTIRSWIKERVLPPARGGGRGAFYGQEHMDRLLFIKRLREQTGTRLPLAMIRSVLERLYASDDPDVVRRVAHGEEPLQVAGLIDPSYDEHVAASIDMMSESPPEAPKAWASMSMSMLEPPEAEVELAATAPSRRHPAHDPWTSIRIQDDLELRLRSDDPDRVAWLARLARKLRQWIQEDAP